jgi:hypothetical protein
MLVDYLKSGFYAASRKTKNQPLPYHQRQENLGIHRKGPPFAVIRPQAGVIIANHYLPVIGAAGIQVRESPVGIIIPKPFVPIADAVVGFINAVIVTGEICAG